MKMLQPRQFLNKKEQTEAIRLSACKNRVVG